MSIILNDNRVSQYLTDTYVSENATFPPLLFEQNHHPHYYKLPMHISHFIHIL